MRRTLDAIAAAICGNLVPALAAVLIAVLVPGATVAADLAPEAEIRIRNILKDLNPGDDVVFDVTVTARQVPGPTPEMTAPAEDAFDVLVPQMYRGSETADWMIAERVEECVGIRPTLVRHELAEGDPSTERTVGMIGPLSEGEAFSIMDSLYNGCGAQSMVTAHAERPPALEQ